MGLETKTLGRAEVEGILSTKLLYHIELKNIKTFGVIVHLSMDGVGIGQTPMVLSSTTIYLTYDIFFKVVGKVDFNSVKALHAEDSITLLLESIYEVLNKSLDDFLAIKNKGLCALHIRSEDNIVRTLCKRELL